MARYEHLPIYRDALNLAVHFEKMGAGLSACLASYLGHLSHADSFSLAADLAGI